MVEIKDSRSPNTPSFSSFRPILDRLLIRQIEQVSAEGSIASLVPEKYRQHTNNGEIIAVGDGVVLGNEWHPLNEFVSPGDHCRYGEYTAEVFDQPEGFPEGKYFIVRIQDLRGVWRKQF